MCGIVDLATHKHVPDVVRADIRVVAATRTTACLTYQDGSSESVDLHPAPVLPDAPVLTEITLRTEFDRQTASKVVEVVAKDYVLDAAGVAHRRPSRDTTATERVSDPSLATSRDPASLFRSLVRNLIMRWAAYVVDHVVHFDDKKLTATLPDRSGSGNVQQTVFSVNGLPVPQGWLPGVADTKKGSSPSSPKAAPPQDCPECYGTGLHKGWGGPCSRGCKCTP